MTSPSLTAEAPTQRDSSISEADFLRSLGKDEREQVLKQIWDANAPSTATPWWLLSRTDRAAIYKLLTRDPAATGYYREPAEH